MVNAVHKSVYTILLLSLNVLLQSSLCFASPNLDAKNQSQYFIENKGQITDQYGLVRSDVDFRLKGSGLSVFIGSGHLHYQWVTTTQGLNNTPQYEAYRLDVVLEGANKSVHPIAEQAAAYYENYYTNRLNGVTAHAYTKLVYKNVYNQIDWVVYLQDGGMKYDFVVHPGGNPNDIKIKYDGATEMFVDNGEVIALTPYGKVTEKVPYTYYVHNKQPVASSYVLTGNTIGFKIENYNAPIVIDPSLEWATYMGDSDNDYGFDIVTDTNKNIYMVGYTGSNTSVNIYTAGAHQVSFAGQEDGFIAKYSPAGIRLWSTYYGGAGKDAINSVAIDGNNDVIFSGVTDTSTTGIATTGSFHPAHGGGNSDAFFGKMDDGGQLQWASYFGGQGSERVGTDYQTAIICDAANNIYLTGTTSSDTGIATTGTAQTTRTSLFDAFIAKFNSNGVRQWGTYYGGTWDDRFTNIDIGLNNMVYVTGNFNSDSMGTAGTFAQYYSTPDTNSISNNRISEVLIAKFNPANGTRVWATYIGGEGNDQSRGIVVGDSSMIYITGSTESTTGVITSGASQSTHGGSYDVFVTKFDSSGQQVWGTYLGDNGTDHGGQVTIDEAGNINLTGSTGSMNNIATLDAHRVNKAGGSLNTFFDALLAIYTPYGYKVWASYYGGVGNDYGNGVAVGSLGHVYFCGNTDSDTGIARSGSQNMLAGFNDAYLAKFTPDTSVFIFQPFNQLTHCSEDSFTLTYGTTAPFRSGNTFIVQLSNASGSFTSPVNIGSKAATTSGTIKCGIPPNFNGFGYRIRIIGNMPIDTSYDNGQDITIRALPIAPVASNNGPVCSNDTLKLFSTSSTSGVTYTWTGPGSYSASTQNAVRVNMDAAQHSGDYIITASISGCSRSDTTTASIIQAAAKPDLTSNSPLCAGDSLKLYAGNYTSGATVAWRGPNNWTDTINLTSRKGNMAIADAGKYIVIYRLNNCESRDTVDVTVGTKPDPVVAGSNSPLCSHQSLQLTASCPTPGVVYNWTGPTFTANNQQNPVRNNLQTTHTGNYIVTADLLGCGVKDTVYVTIAQSPGKPVATSNSPLCSDENLVLTAANITGGATASWRGPNGPVTPPIVKAQTTDAGNYILTSTLSNGCAQSDTVNVAITQSSNLGGITAVITPGTVVCPTADLVFSVSPPQTNANYTWTGPNSFSSSSASPAKNNVQYSDSGFYIVQVVTGACSLGVDTVHLSVVDTISAPVLTLPLFDCEEDSIKLNAYHPYMNKFDFYYPGGSDTGVAGLTILNLNKTVHEGRWILRVRAGGCTAADTGYLTLRPKPDKPEATSNTPICEGETLELKGSSPTAGVSYEWTGPAGYTGNTQNTNLSAVIPGTNDGYYVLQTVLNGCKSDPDSEAVVIHANPRPQISINDPVCEGDEIRMSVNNQQTGETYEWSSSNAGFSGIGASAAILQAQQTDGGTYVVTATSVTTGCKGTTSIPLEVIALPGMPEALYNEPLCEGKQLELNVNDTSTTNVSYAWTGPGSYTFSEKKALRNEIKLTDSGSYIVVASRRGCIVSDTVKVLVKPSPVPPSVINNGPLSSGETLELTVENPTPGASFKWTGPASYGSLVQNPTLFKVTEAASGTYTVITNLDGCTSSGFTVVIVNKEAAKTEELILFPNPNNGKFTIKAKVGSDQIMPYEVLNTLGMVVYSDIVQTVDQQMERDIEIDGSLASGVYFLRIMMSGQSREIAFSVVR